MRVIGIVSAVALVSGCSGAFSAKQEAPPSIMPTNTTPLSLVDMHYADPVADANLAAGNQRFAFLMTQNDETIPGLQLTVNEQLALKDRCGVKVVTGDASVINQYIAQYNLQMLNACQKFAPLSVVNQAN
ncbi:hypothetical protein OE749_17290 [Aestuariibacter sp. AA17]|uniref:Lipoprotein n=1 Tax=Fluctibacter corallii TaxID=2984329 RepID=A0ABT3ACT8_9ALTE|nr:hypothetical protein [Aestuariibacter sp. AA17]MCV2886453.1 hypothetical protein [Aestuariibacter sp. AA17]